MSGLIWTQGPVLKSFVEGERRLHSGMASTPQPDRMKDVIEPEAYAKTVRERQGKVTPLLKNHDVNQIVGTVDQYDVRGDGLHVAGEVLTGTRAADEAWLELRAGALGFYSVGFIPKQKETMANGGTRFTEIDLLEVTLTPVPANPGAVEDSNRTSADVEQIVCREITKQLNAVLERGEYDMRQWKRDLEYEMRSKFEDQLSDERLKSLLGKVDWAL